VPRNVNSLARAQTATACPSCDGPVDVKSRHVQVSGSTVRVYCSEKCQRDAGSGLLKKVVAPPPKPRQPMWPTMMGLAIGLGMPTWMIVGARLEEPPPPAPKVVVAPPAAPEPPKEPEPDPAEAAFVADVLNDAWFHPLAGPRRHMPKNHAQAFGAERPGERPAECYSGHCGVDVGGNLWGEPVLAAHDGVVDRVNRGPNENNGGVYVRLSHRDGTVFTSYFHLAAVPRWITPGTRVAAGQVIGLLGDTGVKESAPHLHFSITVKPNANASERHLDPEPLLAIWPLRIRDGNGTPRVVTHTPPGLPARGRNMFKWKKAKKAGKADAGTVEATPEAEAEPEAAPAPAPAPALPEPALSAAPVPTELGAAP
jgi:hypothetical protein